MKHINESIKIEETNTFEASNDYTLYDAAFKKMVAALPKLNEYVKKKTKIDTKFSCVLNNYRGSYSLDVFSKSLQDLSNIDKALFTEMHFSFGGGQILKDDPNLIWFRPRIVYMHTAGGSNGSEMECLYNLYYDLEKEEWFEK